MPTLQNIILVATGTTTALMAGLFYAYSFSVNPELDRLPDTAYLAAMQSVNRAILNPVFFICFMGSVILLPLSTWVHYGQSVPLRFGLFLVAAIVYLAGVFGVTILGNVPLNEKLDSFNPQAASVEAIAAKRAKFEVTWNNLNTIRTIASTLAAVLLIVACLSPEAE